MLVLNFFSLHIVPVTQVRKHVSFLSMPQGVSLHDVVCIGSGGGHAMN